MSTPENEKHLSEHRAETVLQSIILENSVECDNKTASFVDANVQQRQRSNDEIVEEGEQVSFDAGTKRGAGRKQQHWKSQSAGESVMVQQQALHTNSLSMMGMGQITCPDDDEQTTTNFSANRELWQRRATSQTQLNPPTLPTSKSFRVSQEFREMRQKHTPDLVMDLPLSAQDVGKKSASSSSLSSSSDEETPQTPAQPFRPARTEAATSPTGGPESPDMSTAAERFAKQNQCTLKKNTKTNTDGAKLKRLETMEHDSTEAENDEIVRLTSTDQIADGTVPLRSPLPPRSTPKIVAKFADMHLTGGSQVSSFKPQVKVKPTILRKPVLPLPHPHMSPELTRKIEKQTQSTEQAN